MQERLTNIGPEEFVQSFMKEGTEDAQVCTFKRIVEICSIGNDFVHKVNDQCIEMTIVCHVNLASVSSLYKMDAAY